MKGKLETKTIASEFELQRRYNEDALRYYLDKLLSNHDIHVKIFDQLQRVAARKMIEEKEERHKKGLKITWEEFIETKMANKTIY